MINLNPLIIFIKKNAHVVKVVEVSVVEVVILVVVEGAVVSVVEVVILVVVEGAVVSVVEVTRNINIHN